jgi:hypothetical protein
LQVWHEETLADKLRAASKLIKGIFSHDPNSGLLDATSALINSNALTTTVRMPAMVLLPVELRVWKLTRCTMRFCAHVAQWLMRGTAPRMLLMHA